MLLQDPASPDAKKIENTLRDLGMGKMVDKAILQINRAAEDAAGQAKPIFVDAIKISVSVMRLDWLKTGIPAPPISSA